MVLKSKCIIEEIEMLKSGTLTNEEFLTAVNEKIAEIYRKSSLDEEWRDVVGYEGYYKVSSYGRVMSMNYNHTGVPRIMRGGNHPQGYKNVELTIGLSKKTALVHRLVAQAFLEYDKDKEVNHKDGDKGNNHVANLSMVTPSENMKHAYATNLKKPNKRRLKINFEIAEEIRKKYAEGTRNRDLCKEYDLSSGNISGICHGRKWITP